MTMINIIKKFRRHRGGFGVVGMAVLLPLLVTIALGVAEGLWVLGGKVELGNTVDNIGGTLRETPFENIASVTSGFRTTFINLADTRICATVHDTQSEAQNAAAKRMGGTCTSDNTAEVSTPSGPKPQWRRPFWLGISGEARVNHFTPLGDQLFGNPTTVRYVLTVFVPSSPEDSSGRPTECYTIDSTNTAVGGDVECKSGYFLSNMALTGGEECINATTDLVTSTMTIDGNTYPSGGGWECPDSYQVRGIQSKWESPQNVYGAARSYPCNCYTDKKGNTSCDTCCADDGYGNAGGSYIHDLSINCCRDQVRYTCCPIPPKH
ncbi:MAG: hypothetical protein ACK48P_05850 [Holosporales bacterium]|jgi:Flp pilus assembly protein TadG